MIQLFYNPPSGSIEDSSYIVSTLQITDTNNQQAPAYYSDVTIITSSISITIQSGSSTLSIYPISNTNLYYPPFPTPSLPTTPSTSSYISIDFNFQINSADFIGADLSGSGYSLVSGSTVYLTGSYSPNRGSTVITVPTASSQTFAATVYGSNSATYATALFIISNQGIPPQNYVVTASGSNVSSSANFTMSPSSSYTIYFIVTGSSPV